MAPWGGMFRDLPLAAQALLRGSRLLFHRELRWLILAPLGLMLAVYSALVVTALELLSPTLTGLGDALPEALTALAGVLKMLAWLLVLGLLGILALLLSQTLAAPFYSALARRTERLLTGGNQESGRGLWREVGAAFTRELEKLRWSLPRLAVLFGVSLIPGLGVLAAPLTLLLGAWMLAGQFLDFTQENRGQRFAETLALMKRHRLGVLAFGVPLALGVTLPVLGALVGALAVVSGAVLVLTLRGEHGTLAEGSP